MDRIEYLGIMASFLATFAYLPQVVKTWRTRSAHDFSLPTLSMLVAGAGLWAIYGVLRAAPSIWLGNGVTIVLTVSILSLKLRQPVQVHRETLFRKPTRLLIHLCSHRAT